MYTQSQIRDLQRLRGEALVSLIIPFANEEEKKKGATLLQNAHKEALKQLEANYDPTRAKSYKKAFEALSGDVDFEHSDHGLAIFIGGDVSMALTLPYPPKVGKTVVGTSFQTRDLLAGFQHTPAYFFLILSLEEVKLYKGMGTSLKQVTTGGFPMHYGGPSRTEATGRTLRSDVEYEILEDKRIYLRNVDEALLPFLEEEKLPLFVSGEEESISFLESHDKSGRYITARLHGNYVHTPLTQVQGHLESLLEQYLESQKLRYKSMMDDAVGAHRFSKGIQDVWKDAQLGRIMTMFVEEGYSMGARVLTDDPLTLQPEEDGGGRRANYHDDIIDDCIELVAAMGGETFFMEDDGLKNEGRIACINRYASAE